MMNNDDTDEVLGITRCARCGHRLEGDIECPFCTMFPDTSLGERVPKWVFITSCFLTSPISLYAIVKSRRLTMAEKILAFSGCLLWIGAYRIWF